MDKSLTALNAQERAALESARANMAFEGYPTTDEQAAEVVKLAGQSGLVGELQKAMDCPSKRPCWRFVTPGTRSGWRSRWKAHADCSPRPSRSPYSVCSYSELADYIAIRGESAERESRTCLPSLRAIRSLAALSSC